MNKDFIIILALICCLLCMCLRSENNRYTLFNGQYGVILLDKKTGITWRQVEIDGILAYWEEMLNKCDDAENTLVPIGRKNKVKNALKKVKEEK